MPHPPPLRGECQSRNGGAYCPFFLPMGGLFYVGCLFVFIVGLFWACPHPPMKISAGAHDNNVISSI